MFPVWSPGGNRRIPELRQGAGSDDGGVQVHGQGQGEERQRAGGEGRLPEAAHRPHQEVRAGEEVRPGPLVMAEMSHVNLPLVSCMCSPGNVETMLTTCRPSAYFSQAFWYSLILCAGLAD